MLKLTLNWKTFQLYLENKTFQRNIEKVELYYKIIFFCILIFNDCPLCCHIHFLKPMRKQILWVSSPLSNTINDYLFQVSKDADYKHFSEENTNRLFRYKFVISKLIWSYRVLSLHIPWEVQVSSRSTSTFF